MCTIAGAASGRLRAAGHVHRWSGQQQVLSSCLHGCLRIEQRLDLRQQPHGDLRQFHRDQQLHVLPCAGRTRAEQVDALNLDFYDIGDAPGGSYGTLPRAAAARCHGERLTAHLVRPAERYRRQLPLHGSAGKLDRAALGVVLLHLLHLLDQRGVELRLQRPVDPVAGADPVGLLVRLSASPRVAGSGSASASAAV